MRTVAPHIESQSQLGLYGAGVQRGSPKVSFPLPPPPSIFTADKGPVLVPNAVGPERMVIYLFYFFIGDMYTELTGPMHEVTNESKTPATKESR